MNASPNRQETIETIRQLIDEIHIAMFTTVAEGNLLRSRPMITPRHEFAGDLWFYTRIDDPKVAEIKANPQVNIAYAAPNHEKYVSLSGKAELVTDRKRIEALWGDELREHFPHGLSDDNLALLRVDVSEAEYWDAKAGRLGGFVKSFLGGEQEQEAAKHQKIKWDEAVTVT